MNTIRTIILDDERYACERLRKLLIPFSRIQVIGVFTNSKQGLDCIYKQKPDLVFLDIELENNISAFDIVDQINNNIHHPHIILVTAHSQYSIKAIKNEVFDYILKPVDVDELKETIDRFVHHISCIPKTIEEKFTMLSEREKTVLKFVLDGKTSSEIANILFLSINTIHTHRRNILKKTNSKSILDILQSTNISND
jgi:DNA-binding NarL/FixJ family response regulator